MKPRILGISSTPRTNGNSDILLDHLLEGVVSGGAEVEKVRIAKMWIVPCRACDACKRAKPVCVVDDDMGPLVEKVREADGFIFATPVYFFGASAQMKTFLDRLYVLMNDEDIEHLKGKKALVAVTYGDEDVRSSGAENVKKMFEDIFDYIGMELHGWVHASCGSAEEVLENQEVLDEAVLLGKDFGRTVIG